MTAVDCTNQQKSKLRKVTFSEFVKSYLDCALDDIPMPDAKAVATSAA